MEFKDFFNCYDTVGTQHTGFLQSMNFSGLTGTVTFLNELTMAFMDAYLYNELSQSLVMRHWAQYMHYSRENARFEIMAQFYTDFVNALAAKLMRAEKWYQLTKVNFESLSATDIKTIEHGTKETVKDYGEDETTRAYGEDEQTNIYGSKQNTNAYGEAERTNVYGQTQDTNAYGIAERTNVYGQTQDTTQYGATEQSTVYGATQQTQQHGQQQLTKDYDTVVVTVAHNAADQHVIGQTHAETDGTTTDQLYPLGGSAFIDDKKQIVHSETDTNAQTNTDTWGDVETSTDARQDKETQATYTDTVSDIQHTDTVTGITHTDTVTGTAHTDTQTDAAHTDTLTTAQHTDTLTDAAHTDTLTEGAHTDTLTRAEREDVETRAARRDTEQIKAYVDTERHTKHIIISPEKYYAIEKELADIGVYDLMKDAVRETMLLCVWEGGYLW